jgi:hypothetical protein
MTEFAAPYYVFVLCSMLYPDDVPMYQVKDNPNIDCARSLRFCWLSLSPLERQMVSSFAKEHDIQSLIRKRNHRAAELFDIRHTGTCTSCIS